VSADSLVSEVDLGASRLTLYGGRLVHNGAGATEIIPLAQLASVRIAFEREAGKLASALVLGAAALLLLAIARPLQGWLRGAAATVSGSGRRESLDALLHSVFEALAGVADALPAAGAALFALAAAALFLWWYGRTTLTLSFAATERAISVRGRSAALMEFAETLGERLSELTRASAR
jgi:hypothetical protein